VVLGAGLLVLVGGFLWSRSAGTPKAEHAASRDSQTIDPELSLSDLGRDPRAPIGEARSPPESRQSPSSVPRPSVRGRVVDLLGHPVVGARLHRRDDPTHVLGRCGPEGKFELSLPDGPPYFVLEAEDDRWASVRGAAVDRGVASSSEFLLVVGPAVDLAGTVATDSGHPVGAARVSLPLYRELLTAFPLPLDAGIAPEITTEADSEGRFRLPHAPGIAGSLLTASAAGYRPGFLRLDGRGDSNLAIVVREDPSEVRAIEGLVLRPEGTPAEGAQVRLWNLSASTDGRGAFRLDRPDGLPDEAALVASLEGFQSSVRSGFGEFAKTASDHELRSLVVFLGPEALSLEGSVVDGKSREPLSGWTVSVVDGTEIARERTPPLFAENLAAGPHPTGTDPSGRFRVRGLYPRDYTLRAYDPKSLRSVRAGPFEAGRRDVVLSVGPDDVHPRVAGRVVSRTGRPVVAARVSLGLVTWRASGGRKLWIPGASATTDDEGRFVLENVPRTDVQLDVTGDEVMPASFDLDQAGDPEILSLSVALRCHFRVVADGPVPPASWIEVFDATGGALEIYAFEASVWMSSPKQGLDESGSGVLAVSEDARSLRVFAGGEEQPELLLESPLSLDPVGVTQVNVSLPKSGR
jgi:hypothetical protein